MYIVFRAVQKRERISVLQGIYSSYSFRRLKEYLLGEKGDRSNLNPLGEDRGDEILTDYYQLFFINGVVYVNYNV